jgi:hypothetical protein
MIKEKENTISEIVIDLTGSDGNVFNLIGQGRRLCKQLGLDANEFTTKMTSGDYENAVTTFDEYFGHFVTLLR